MAGVANVTLMGNLTRDPETRFSQGGTAIVKFGVAANRRRKNSQGEWVEKPVFVDVTMFGKRGEAFARFHRKGDTCLLFGSLDFDQWEDRQSGQKRSKLYVVADQFEFVGAPKEAGGPPAEEKPDTPF